MTKPVKILYSKSREEWAGREIRRKGTSVVLLTRECDYALRTVRALAQGGRQSVGSICREEHLPHQYAYKILKKLEHAQIVRSFRGIHGGYELCRPLDRLTIYDVLAAIDDSLFINECLEEDYRCPNNLHHWPCRLHEEFRRLQAMLVEGLREKTLDQIL